MSPTFVRATVACTLLGWLTVAASGGDAPPKDKAEDRFEKLLAAAKKDPAKADWKALRLAFSDTEAYKPYSTDWREEIKTIQQKMQDGDLKGAEALLKPLLERDRYMRLDAHLTAGLLYSRTGQKEKAGWHQDFIKGIIEALVDGGKGLSFQEPIDVLFIDEEYFFLRMLELKGKRQGLILHEGHKFDVYTTEADGPKRERTFYFRVDWPQKSLEKSLKPLLESTKKEAKRKSDAAP